MPVISKIRFTNVIYEGGNKRYQDETFHFDGNNSTIVLENGGGKTVWVQAALQAILPHTEVANRKAYETFLLSEGAAHIAIEWIINQKPRRYLVTAVTLYDQSQRLQSYRYVYEYGADDPNSIENIPYVEEVGEGGKRPVDRLEIQDYYTKMAKNHMNAEMFSTIEKYNMHLSKYHIITAEWKKIAQINGTEGGVGVFFEGCKTSSALVEKLLIPVVEDAISGNGTKNFVDSFEKQREHIKKYKQLKHQINQCQLILGQVKGFTGNFEKWDREQKALQQLKSQAKSVFYFIQNEYEKNIKEYEGQLQRQETITKELETLTYKENSYKILMLQKEGEEKRKQYQEALVVYEKQEQELGQTNHRIASLEYAQISQALEDSTKEDERVKESIKRLSQDDVTAEIQESLREDGQYLCGYYKNALEEMEKEISQFESEKQRTKDQFKEDQVKKSALEKEKEELEISKTTNEVNLERTQTDMKDLEQSILDRPQHETVGSKRIDLQKRLEEIENETRQNADNMKHLENEQESLGTRKTTLTSELDHVKDLLWQNENQLSNLTTKQDKILQKIHMADYRWSQVESLYTSPLILSGIETKIEQTYAELKQAMQAERISRRWLDDYEKGDYFLADPVIVGRLEDWEKEFDLILTGSEYIKDTKTSQFPYWAITLITTDREIQKLRGYIQDNKDAISHPIWVMTEHEAGRYREGDYNPQTDFIYPGLWENNTHQPTFIKWKNQLEEQAKIAETKTKEIQYIHRNWEALKQEILDFKDQYPLALFHELEENVFSLKKERNEKEKDLNNIYNREKEILTELKMLRDQERELGHEKAYTEDKVRQAINYLAKAKEEELYKKELREIINPRLRTIKPHIRSLIQNIQTLNDQLSKIKYDLEDKRKDKGRIQDQFNQSGIKDYPPLYSSYSKEALEGQRESLQRELAKKQRGRGELEEQLKRIKKDLSLQQEQLEKKRLEIPDLNQGIRFITEHKEEIKTLIIKGNKLARQMKPLGETKEYLKTKYYEHRGNYDGKKEEFHKTYSALYKWEESLNKAGEDLKKQRKDLTSQMGYIQRQIQKAQKDLDETRKAKDYLTLKHEGFKYLTDDIVASELTESETLDILYGKEKYTHQMIYHMEQATERVKIKKSQLSKEEQRFIDFCKREITDIRLRELTLKGIEKLIKYEEVAQWENNLNRRIMQTKKIAEDDIKTHEEELELFISFIHSYVKQVAEGLGEIHRKTRVKIDGNWRDVYTIKVPDWGELDGKEAIQNYILWIIEELERGGYPEGEHRKQMEKWLSVKQLLGIVTRSRPVTVRCRKLTNQNTLAPTASSWESSNKWSGGERWSKNMILFLGLLNFLAEKTGHVIEGEKRNRTVILDNPFGQASSDHVLNPVFFVAEQLGFQIVTLTALAEGSFIRKYFPVVYSCRLRSATDGTQIMSKELEIQRALFKDDELPSITRLETQEQLGLL